MFRILASIAFAFLFDSAPALAAAAGEVAPPPAAGTVYVVGYVELLSSGVGAGLPALREYRDAASREPNAVSVQIFREEGAPTRFMLIEAWRQQADYDTHLKAPSVSNLVMKLRAAQAAPPDMRPHRGYTIGTPPATPPATAPAANTVYVMSHIDIPPPLFAQFVPLLRPYVDGSRKDRGMVRFDLLQAVAPRQNHITVLEAWAGATPLEQHKTAVHTRTFRQHVHPLLGSLYDERMYRLVN
jgi:quinol monooxygenase YgiN